MLKYQTMLRTILKYGHDTGDRTGIGTRSLAGYFYQIKLKMDKLGVVHNYPLHTSKRVFFRGVFEELMWKLRGETNIRSLVKKGINIWTEWCFKPYLEKTGQDKDFEWFTDDTKSEYSDEWKRRLKEFSQRIIDDDEFAETWGDLGPTYGHQMRKFDEKLLRDLPQQYAEAILAAFPDLKQTDVIIPGIDQVAAVIDLIRNKPEDRRIIMTLWNPSDNKYTALPPCPCFYQFFANQKGYLHLNVYQRSCDSFLGVPFNDAQDALLLILMAKLTGRKPGNFNHFFGDDHIYFNAFDQVRLLLSRKPRGLPSIKINRNITNLTDLTEIEFKDIEILNYDPYDPIKAAIAV